MPNYQITAPDGKTYKITAPDGVSQEQILAYAKANYSKASSKEKTSAASAVAQGIGQGATLGFGDKLSAVVADITARATAPFVGLSQSDLTDGDGNGPYAQALASLHADEKKAYSDHPVLNTLGNLGGAILTGSAGVKALGALAPTAAEGLSTYAAANPIRTAIGTGALQGGTYGAGTGEGTLGERLKTVAVDSALGGTAGGVGGAVLNNLAPAILSKAGLSPSALAESRAVKAGEINPTDTLTTAEQKIQKKLTKDGDLNTILNDYSTNGKTLIESAGQNTENLGDTANLFPSARPVIKEAIDDRIADSSSRVAQSAASNISPATDADAMLKSILDKGRAKAAPLYDEAFSVNQSIKTPLIDKILETPEGKSALAEAEKNVNNEIALKQGHDPDLEGISNELAQPENGLKLKTLDYVKRSMDSTISQAYRAGDNAQAARITALKNGLLGEMKANDATGGSYEKALKTSGDYFSNRDALEAGQSVLKVQTTPQQVQKTVSALGPTELEAYRSGISSQIVGKSNNITDGRNTVAYLKSPAVRQKLAAALTPNGYAKIMDTIADENKLFQIRNKLGGSQTANRAIAADEDFGQHAAQFGLDIATKGPTTAVLDAGKNLVQRLFSNMRDQSALDVAKILVETDPRKKLQIVQRLQQTAENRQNQVAATAAAKKLNAYFQIYDKIRLANPNTGTAGAQNRSQ